MVSRLVWPDLDSVHRVEHEFAVSTSRWELPPMHLPRFSRKPVQPDRLSLQLQGASIFSLACERPAETAQRPASAPNSFKPFPSLMPSFPGSTNPGSLVGSESLSQFR